MLSSGLSGQCSRHLLWALQSINTAASDPAKMQVSHTTLCSALQWLSTPNLILEKRPKSIQWPAGPPQGGPPHLWSLFSHHASKLVSLQPLWPPAVLRIYHPCLGAFTPPVPSEGSLSRLLQMCSNVTFSTRYTT